MRKSYNSLFLSLCLLVIAIAAGVTYIGKAFFAWSNTTAVVTTVALTVVMGVFKLLFIWRGDWKTQTIEYKHRSSSSRVIEFQMMNPGPGSYKKRYVDKTKLLPGLSWTKEIDDSNIDLKDWERVEIDVNELGLKYP